jgi:hypothetical protein
MEESLSDSADQPPTLSPVVRKSQRTKAPFKDLPPVLEPSKAVATTSTSSTPKFVSEFDKKDQIIQRLRNSLLEKNTELNLLKKKLKITEELLQFYQKNHWEKDDNLDSLIDMGKIVSILLLLLLVL